MWRVGVLEDESNADLDLRQAATAGAIASDPTTYNPIQRCLLHQPPQTREAEDWRHYDSAGRVSFGTRRGRLGRHRQRERDIGIARRSADFAAAGGGDDQELTSRRLVNRGRGVAGER